MNNENAVHKLTKQEIGKLVRQKFLSLIKQEWGDYKSLKGYLYRFENGNKILTVYSSLNNDRWWFGVSELYWSNWDENTYLAILMRDEKKCECVLLNPRVSQKLLDKIEPVKDNQKKINVRIPSAGKIYIQEWQDFPFEQKTVSLGNIETEDSDDKLNQVPFERAEIDYIESAKAAFAKMSKEEREAFIEKLRNM
jgi:hypothetical protein